MPRAAAKHSSGRSANPSVDHPWKYEVGVFRNTETEQSLFDGEITRLAGSRASQSGKYS